MTRWIVETLGPDVPLHFTAFHPAWRLLDRPPTPLGTLTRARSVALANGVRYAYTGNVVDVGGQSTWCHRCGARLVERDGYRIGEYRLTAAGRCEACGAAVPGVFAGRARSLGHAPAARSARRSLSPAPRYGAPRKTGRRDDAPRLPRLGSPICAAGAGTTAAPAAAVGAAAGVGRGPWRRRSKAPSRDA